MVLPAKDCQPELDLTLAALANQSYPADLTEVLVVDDDSSVPLRVPALAPPRTRVLRLAGGAGHGSGRARHAGAVASSGEIILFLDADMVATQTHLEAHARWHHHVADAVVIGRKRFVDFAGVDPQALAEAVRTGTVDGLLAGRRQSSHSWLEQMITQTDGLQEWREDTFLAVVGASVSTSRDLYLESGGFSSYGLRGIVDTEFGYRIFTSGAVIIPEQGSLTYHQGLRNFATRGDEIKRERAGLAANRLPIPLFRPTNRGRSWAVPMVVAVVDATVGTQEEVLLTLDTVLGSAFTDLSVRVGPADAVPTWVRDYFAADPRVAMEEGPVRTGFPSPYTLVVPVGTNLAATTIDVLLTAIEQQEVGVVRVEPVVEGGRGVELWATRALQRSRRHGVGDLEQTGRELFGEHWLTAQTVGASRSEVAITRQGMVREGSAAAQ